MRHNLNSRILARLALRDKRLKGRILYLQRGRQIKYLPEHSDSSLNTLSINRAPEIGEKGITEGITEVAKRRKGLQQLCRNPLHKNYLTKSGAEET